MYEYDGVGRLKKEIKSGGSTNTYYFDRHGNRVLMTVTTGPINYFSDDNANGPIDYPTADSAAGTIDYLTMDSAAGPIDRLTADNATGPINYTSTDNTDSWANNYFTNYTYDANNRLLT